MKIETMADISIPNSNPPALYMILTWLQCSMMYIASLKVIRSGPHTMPRDYHSKSRHPPWSQIIIHNHICYPLKCLTSPWNYTLTKSDPLMNRKTNRAWNIVCTTLGVKMCCTTIIMFSTFQWPSISLPN